MKNIIIVGNKHDLEAKRRVSEMEITQFCDSMGCTYIRTSVLANTGIEDLISTTIEKSIELENSITGSILSSDSIQVKADSTKLSSDGM